MTVRAINTPTLQTVTVGRQCVGFVLRRGDAYEAFDYGERSLGLFDTASAAANAVADEVTDDAGL